jgi:hypothetical protein
MEFALLCMATSGKFRKTGRSIQKPGAGIVVIRIVVFQIATMPCTIGKDVRYHLCHDASCLTAPGSSRRLRWLLALPKLRHRAAAGRPHLAALAAAPERTEEERSALIKDVLWLEQNLRFHLDGNEEQFQQLAADLGTRTARKRTSACAPNTCSRTPRIIAQILWFDAKQQVIDSLPTAPASDAGSKPSDRR